MKLFMFPFAGGNSSFFMSWKSKLDDFIHAVPAELPGRGMRISEPLCSDMNELVNDMYHWMVQNYDLTEKPYAFFGHSMGGLIAYELYYKLLDHNEPLPIHLFISGIKPPHLKRKHLEVEKLDDNELLKEVIKLGGTPEELLYNEELLDYFLPIIRSDFKLVENYQYEKKETKINCSISILNGVDDRFDPHEIDEWRNYTNHSIKINYYEGGHFYLNNHILELSKYIGSVLKHLNQSYSRTV